MNGLRKRIRDAGEQGFAMPWVLLLLLLALTLGAATNLYTIGVDLTGAEVAFPNSAPALDPQDIPTAPIVFYGANFIVVNGGDRSATFLVLQGIGEYDFVPLAWLLLYFERPVRHAAPTLATSHETATEVR